MNPVTYVRMCNTFAPQIKGTHEVTVYADTHACTTPLFLKTSVNKVFW